MHGEKSFFWLTFKRMFYHFFDDRKFFGSVLKKSFAKYNIQEDFQLHLPVILTRALVVAESGPKQKSKRTNDKDEQLLI